MVIGVSLCTVALYSKQTNVASFKYAFVQVDGRSAKKSKSWKNRLSGFFKRDKRRERDLAGGESLPPDKGKIRPKKRSSQSEEKAGDDVPGI